MKLLISSLLVSLALLSMIFPTYFVYSSSQVPLAIGFGDESRYILYSNGELYKLLNNGAMKFISKLNLTDQIFGYSIKDFEVYEGYLYLYLYKSYNESSGETVVEVYNLDNGEIIYNVSYNFKVIDNNNVDGNIVIAISACQKGYSILLTNGVNTTIKVYRLNKSTDDFVLIGVYEGASCSPRILRAISAINDRHGWIFHNIRPLCFLLLPRIHASALFLHNWRMRPPRFL